MLAGGARGREEGEVAAATRVEAIREVERAGSAEEHREEWVSSGGIGGASQGR